MFLSKQRVDHFAWYLGRIALAILAMLALLLGRSVDSFAQEPPGLEIRSAEQRYGVMVAGPREFRFILADRKNSEGAVRHELISLDEGGAVFELDPFTEEAGSLKFSLKRTQADYEGVKDPKSDAFQGKWKQAGMEFPLNFYRKAPWDDGSLKEVWVGDIRPLFQKLTLQIRIHQREGVAEQLLFDSLTQGAGGFQGERKIEGDQWTIEIASLGGKFEGKANTELSTVDGKWTQGGTVYPLKLERQAAPVQPKSLIPKRPQTPKAPFPYREEELAIEGKSEGVKLSGTLTMPEGKGPFPTAILISGSGPQDRDETLVDHRPFRVLSDFLARKGIAVYRYDERGVGKSTGDFAKATTQDFAEDVDAIVAVLKKDSRLLATGIGLIGHSEGGIVAPLVASQREDVAFVVLLAGTGVNGKEILLSQGELIARAEGANDETKLKQQRELQTLLMDYVLDVNQEQGKTKQENLDALMAKAMLIAEVEDDEKEMFRTNLQKGIENLSTPWFRFFLSHEPVPVLRKVKCPVLALNGEKDTQVAVELNLVPIESALRESGNQRFEIVRLPGLNHLFQECSTGALSEYQTIEQTMSPSVLEKIAAWVGSLDLGK